MTMLSIDNDIGDENESSVDDSLQPLDTSKDQTVIIGNVPINIKEAKQTKSRKQKATPKITKPIICKVCGKEFPSRNNLYQHQQAHSSERKFECNICHKRFLWSSNLYQHKHTHSKERIYPCDICGKRFSNKNNRYNHRRLHTLEKRYSCDVCEKKFITRQGLKDHLLIHFGERNFICEHCGKGFLTIADLKRHDTIHKREAKFKCHLCDEMFHKLVYLKQHGVKHFGFATWHCGICKKFFNNGGNYHNHLSKHSDEKQFDCSKCGKKFRYKYSIKKHTCDFLHAKKFRLQSSIKENTNDMNSSQNELSFQCITCGKCFARKLCLNLHQRVHSERRHACIVCGARFLYKINLISHKKCHNEGDPFQCKFCDKTFKWKWYRNIHLSKHLSVWKFECEICEKRFSTSSQLNRHQLVHLKKRKLNEKCIECTVCKISFPAKDYRQHKKTHSENHYDCATCGERFSSMIRLSRHAKSHSDIVEFSCNVCHKSFVKSGSLNRHKMIHFREKTFECTICGQFIKLGDFRLHNQMHREEPAGSVIYSGENNAEQKVCNVPEMDNSLTTCEPNSLDQVKSETLKSDEENDFTFQSEKSCEILQEAFNNNDQADIKSPLEFSKAATQSTSNPILPPIFNTTASASQSIQVFLVIPSSNITSQTNQGLVLPNSININMNNMSQSHLQIPATVNPLEFISGPILATTNENSPGPAVYLPVGTPSSSAHTTKAYQSRRYTCPHCGKTFAHSSSLWRHKKTHTHIDTVVPKSET